MKNFFQKQREIIALLVWVGIITALVYFVILPLIGRINGINDQIQEESMKQESARKHLGELPKIQQQYAAIQKDEGLADVLLDKNNAVMLFERLEKLAEDSGNKITIAAKDATGQNATPPVRGKAAVDNSLVDSLPSSDYLQLKITLTGDYNSINKFIDALEWFEYYCDIIGIQVGKNDQVADASQQAVNMQASNPFGVNAEKKIAQPSRQDPLVATLDAVFYTKKQ